MKKIFIISILTILISCCLINNAKADTFEEFLENDQAVNAIYRDRLSGQTFTAISSHNVVGVKLWLRTPATRYTPINVYLTETKNGEITKEWSQMILTQGIIYASSINPLINGNQYHLIFDDTSIYLATDTIYALILEDREASSSAWTSIRGGGNGYEFGANWYKEEGQEEWILNEDSDLYFKIIGEINTSSEDMCTCTTTLTQISNASTGAAFWLDSSISFGDFLIITFLMSIFVLLLVQFIFKLEITPNQKVRVRIEQ